MLDRISKYKHIIWDWNGTLINDIWLVVEIMNKMLKKRNLPGIDAKKYREIFNFPVTKYYLKLGFDFSNESFEELTVEFISEYYQRFNECKLFDEAEEVLKKIRDMGISQSILSVLLVGDTAHDYIVSKHIGSDCLLIANGHYSYERLARLGVDVVSSLKEITKI
jgi:phosphoglycolate phosphatase